MVYSVNDVDFKEARFCNTLRLVKNRADITLQYSWYYSKFHNEKRTYISELGLPRHERGS